MIKTFNQFTKSLNEEQTEIIDISDESVYPRKGESIKSNNFFIIHHTAGLGDAHDVVHTLNGAKNKKGENVKLGVQWVVDRDGIIYKTLPTNSRGAHVGVSTGDRGAPAGISNSNAQGVEVIGKNDPDVLRHGKTNGDVQAIAVLKIIKHLGYTKDQIFGHGEVNPGKMADEGAYIKQYVMDHWEDPIDLSVFDKETRSDTARPMAAGSTEKVATIDSDLIKRLIAKLKEKNFSQADLDKFSTSLTAGKGTNFKAGGGFPEQNMKELEKSMDRNGITNEFARKAVLGVISKESSKAGSETSYFSTPLTRIREVFKDRLTKYSDQEIEGWRQLGKLEFDHKFWEAVYGGMYGNTEPGDGEKYRGRGFNGITFKGNYANLQKVYNKTNQVLGSIDIVSNTELLEKPEVAAEFAILYFIDSFKRHGKDPNNYTDLDSAVTDYIRSNAGWGTSLDGAVVSVGFQKAKAFANSLTSTATA